MAEGGEVFSNSFQQASGGSGATQLSDALRGILQNQNNGLSDALSAAAKQIEDLRIISESQADAITSNTAAIWQNTAAQASGGLKGAASTIGRAASSFLGSSLGMVPAISAITKLFGGGGQAEPPPLPRYTAPAPIQFDEINTGLSRSILQPAPWAADRGNSSTPVTAANNALAGRGEAASSPSAPQITVQVQAMDSRSFMDHSHEIAQAVRQAMLNMHSLNDVVVDL